MGVYKDTSSEPKLQTEKNIFICSLMNEENGRTINGLLNKLVYSISCLICTYVRMCFFFLANYKTVLVQNVTN